MKIGIFWENVKLGKFSTESEKLFGNMGKSATGGNTSSPQEGGLDAPVFVDDLLLTCR